MAGNLTLRAEGLGSLPCVVQHKRLYDVHRHAQRRFLAGLQTNQRGPRHTTQEERRHIQTQGAPANQPGMG